SRAAPGSDPRRRDPGHADAAADRQLSLPAPRAVAPANRARFPARRASGAQRESEGSRRPAKQDQRPAQQKQDYRKPESEKKRARAGDGKSFERDAQFRVAHRAEIERRQRDHERPCGGLPVDRRFHESDFAVEIFQQRRAGRKHPGQRRHRVAQEILHQVRRRLSARRNAGGAARKKRGEKGLNQLLDNILERPPAQKLAILAATIILLGALYYSFIYS